MSGPKRHGHANDEETFYMHCRAAYLSLFKSSLTNITSKQQLCRVLQQAGRNPSQATLNKYWTPRTTKLNFDDFCEILKSEVPTEESELLRAFKKMDVNRDGCISHKELFDALTSRGEKMKPEEVNVIFSLADTNKDGKLDYAEFCRLLLSTAEQCQNAALERVEADAKLKKQNFGNQPDSPPQNAGSVANPQPPITPPRSELDGTLRKDSHPPSRSSSARSRRSSLSNSVTMAASAKCTRPVEPASLQEWSHASARGCLFLEEDGGVSSLQYRLHLPQTTCVYLTIQPLNLSQRPDKPSSWMAVDTALFVVSGGDTKEESSLVGFTEQRDKEKFVWKGELNAGTYFLLPFTTGCRLRKRRRKSTSKPVQLVNTSDSGQLDLTPEFRGALSDIFEVIDLDGNGLLSLEEYNFFEMRTSGEKCDEEAWVVCKENFDTRRNQLTRQGFMELNQMEASERGGDPTDLWLTLEAMGYNHALEMVEACPFLLDAYCEQGQLSVQPVSLDAAPRMLNAGLHKSITARGEARALRGEAGALRGEAGALRGQDRGPRGEDVLLYTYKGEHRISSLIANKSSHKVTVHVNNEQSTNCSSSRGMSLFAVEVPAKTKMVCQHVLPTNEKQDWTYSCLESIIPC
ncbi:EF-hand calcium-binding domain-containing protein 7 [Hypomesus transpacificus]|uniref:EF-hand calcium-binding domain-containing protein 7 n=1 Tax=Hypomesus transpacificus TaxID=137520 RepID=UPI001F07C9A7|nr:EF-hand calcium-binding domain-containing protein 7 [Hypomesus transpacificus]